MRGKFFAALTSLAVAGVAALSLGLSAAPATGWAADATPPAKAKPCRDATGKFAKCPAPDAAKPKPCRDAKGKFIKCPKP